MGKLYKHEPLLTVHVKSIDATWTKRVFVVREADYPEIKKFLIEMDQKAIETVER